MKKLICILLAVIMVLGCSAVCAEAAQDSEKTKFLLIQGEEKDDPAPVYAKKEDEDPTDWLSPGTICGLIQDLTEKGENWYHIIYINQKKEGATGFIFPDKAKILTLGECRKLAEDPNKANEMMDLLDATEAYLQAMKNKTDPAKQAASADEPSSPEISDKIKAYYDEAMDALKQLSELDFSDEMNQLRDMGEELLGSAVDTGLDVLETAAEGAGQLLESAGNEVKERLKDSLSDAADAVGDLVDTVKDEFVKQTEGELSETAEEIIEKLDEVLDKIRDADTGEININMDEIAATLKEINEEIGILAGDAGEVLKEKMDDLLSQIEEIQMYGEMAGGLVESLAETAREEGILEATDQLLDIIRLMIQFY